MKTVKLLPTGKEFRLNNIFCIGKNYADHAKEMGGDVPKEPVIFLKPTSAVITNGEPIIIPSMSSNVHHEIELTVLLGKGGKNIPLSSAMDHVAGYGVGLDMTMRDRQSDAKKAGNPWTVAKGFDTSAPLSPFISASSIIDPHTLDITLTVNGEIRQQSNTQHMIFRIEVLISYLSSIFTLEEGDIIYTGTPEGVAQVGVGDQLTATIPGVGTIQHTIQ
ncbi:MAG: fumarylacetoacetate hydrolase family protein [Bacteriovoracaceae bacterium]|nr:fumarylacetoacetate hydrolase family protein [Bacteroidota bacterium]